MPQATAFENIQAACKDGWKTEALHKKKWTVHFVAEHLEFLLVLQRQVEKEKEVQGASKEQSTWASSSSTGVPKANNLKRAFCKLWLAYKKLLKLYLQAEREEENVVHCTLLLFLHLTGLRVQDQVPWGKYVRFETKCPVCKQQICCGHPMRSMQMMLAYLPQLMPMVVIENLLQQRIGSGVTVIIRTGLETSQELGAGGVLS